GPGHLSRNDNKFVTELASLGSGATLIRTSIIRFPERRPNTQRKMPRSWGEEFEPRLSVGWAVGCAHLQHESAPPHPRHYDEHDHSNQRLNVARRCLRVGRLFS